MLIHVFTGILPAGILSVDGHYHLKMQCTTEIEELITFDKKCNQCGQWCKTDSSEQKKERNRSLEVL